MKKSGSGLDPEALLPRLLPTVYRMSVDDQAAGLLMARLGGAIGAHWSVILAHPCSGGAPMFAAAHGMPAASMAAYDQYFHRLEPWPAWSKRAGVAFGSPALSQDMATVSEFRRTEYYHDFWRSHADLLHTAGSLFKLDHRSFGHVAFPRERRFGEYPESTKRLIAALSPHLGAALAARFRLEALEQRAQIALAEFERLPQPLFWRGDLGRWQVLNSAGEVWLTRQRELRLEAGRWSGRGPRSQWIAERLNSLAEPRAERFTLGHGKRMQTLELLPLPPMVSAFDPTATLRSHTLLRVEAGPSGRPSTAQDLALRWQLSPAESAVCQFLLRGEKTNQIAERRGTRRETVRSQVKTILSKAGVSNRAQLLLAAAAQTWPQNAGGAS